MITNASKLQILGAIDRVNVIHGYTIYLHTFEKVSQRRNRFTIRAETGEPGSRYGQSGRRGPWASWHAHGYLFDQLFATDPDIFIITGGRTITKDEGNWQDQNIGSLVNPVLFSEVSIHS